MFHPILLLLLLADPHPALTPFAQRPLKQGPNPTTWVDSERWCIAHACLATSTRLDEANQYLAEVQPVAMFDGFIADTDVQLTDLLRTYLQFKDTDKLTPSAKAHLKQFFADWRVPNPDRNRNADTHYEWPGEYTENHTLNILVGVYLIDVALDRDRTLHRQLLQQFLLDRARWGWSEFHSPNYGIVTAKALTCLVDFAPGTAPDKPLADAASMTLDLLAIAYANQSAGLWRGIPFARGAGREIDNSANSWFDLARCWFTPPGEPIASNDTFLPHLLTSSYRPPDAAVDMIRNPQARGSYTMTTVATHGPARLRIPITIHVTPHATLASAQGFGSYYSGCYWSISFASGPRNVVTGNYAGGRNILQRGNVLATFGSVTWHGSLNPVKTDAVTLGGDEHTWVGQIDLADDAHVLMVASRSEHATVESFHAAVDALKPSFIDGVLAWTMPAGETIRMINERDGKRWRLVRAEADGKLIRLDANMLYSSPHMQSVRGSAVTQVLGSGRKRTYDFRDIKQPRIVDDAEATLTPQPSDEITGPAGIKLIYIPAGDFPMGSPVSEGRANEAPQRWVDLPGYYLSQTEITVGQYAAYLAVNPDAPRPPDWYKTKWGKTDDYPMTYITWHEANAFCRWLSFKSGKSFDLPTEAQWEKAAKGFAHRVYPWGDTYDGSQSGTPNTTYAPVGAKPSDVSPFGILDMAGNAWEWCADLHDPAAPAPGLDRALRGCGWNYDPDTFRCAYRSRLNPDDRSVHIGFRVVREP